MKKRIRFKKYKKQYTKAIYKMWQDGIIDIDLLIGWFSACQDRSMRNALLKKAWFYNPFSNKLESLL